MAAEPERARKRVRGSATGRPIMVLLDLLGRRWTLRVLWELRNGASTFRDLQKRCGDISPTVLNRRLQELRDASLIEHTESGYAHTVRGAELAKQLAELSAWANQWAKGAGKP